MDKGVAPVFLMTNTLPAKSWPFLAVSSIPGMSFSIFQVIFMKGVLFRSILISLPRPEAALSAIAFK